jgi:hypothetical protein
MAMRRHCFRYLRILRFVTILLSLAACELVTFTPDVTPLIVVGPSDVSSTQTAEDIFTPLPIPSATQEPLILPGTTYVVGPDEVDCQAIAAMHGISLDQLYDANPTIKSDDPDVCYIYEELELTIPELFVRTLGESVGLYSCVDEAPKTCLSPDDSADFMLAHVLFGEGGSTLGKDASANVMYVLTNRVNQILRARDKDPGSLTDEEYKQLLIHVASEPYYDDEGNMYPAFNAFDADVEHPKEGEIGYENWYDASSIVDLAVKSRGQDFSPYSIGKEMNESVIAYCAPEPGSGFLNETIFFEHVDNLGENFQYYFTYHQFYNAGGKEFCETYANYD